MWKSKVKFDLRFLRVPFPGTPRASDLQIVVTPWSLHTEQNEVRSWLTKQLD